MSILLEDVGAMSGRDHRRSPMRGVVFGVLFSLPFWLAVLLLLRHVH